MARRIPEQMSDNIGIVGPCLTNKNAAQSTGRRFVLFSYTQRATRTFLTSLKFHFRRMLIPMTSCQS